MLLVGFPIILLSGSLCSYDLPHDHSFYLFNLFFLMFTHHVLFLESSPLSLLILPSFFVIPFSCFVIVFLHTILASYRIVDSLHCVDIASFVTLGLLYIKASLAFCKINQEVFSLSLTSKSKSKLKFYKSKFKTGHRLPVVFDLCLHSSPVKSSSHVA